MRRQGSYASLRDMWPRVVACAMVGMCVLAVAATGSVGVAAEHPRRLGASKPRWRAAPGRSHDGGASGATSVVRDDVAGSESRETRGGAWDRVPVAGSASRRGATARSKPGVPPDPPAGSFRGMLRKHLPAAAYAAYAAVTQPAAAERDTVATQSFLAVTSPQRGQSVTTGSSTAISWANTDDVRTLTIILCYKAACDTVLANNQNSTAGAYAWTVPASQAPGDEYHIELSAENVNNLTALSAAFSIVTPDDSAGYGPYLGIAFAVLVLIGLCCVYAFHRRRTRKSRLRRTRLELAHTRQQERLLEEFERRYNLLLPRCTTPYTGGKLICDTHKWTYTAPRPGANNSGELSCVSGVFQGMQFEWMGSAETGCVELRCVEPRRKIGYCDWDGDVLRWHSPVRVRRRGNGYIWRYETSTDLSHFMLHGRQRGVSFADETVPHGESPAKLFPRLWAMQSGLNGHSVLAPKRPSDMFSPVGIEGSVPPLLALCVALLPAAMSELSVQMELYETQVAGERKDERVRRRQRALRMFGRIAFVSRFADVKVQVVRSDDADMRVQIVKGFTPDQPCMWQIVPPTANPDYCVQLVKRNPDFTVKYVKSFPGVQIPAE